MQGLAGYQQQDAHEYYQSLLNHLHSSRENATAKDSKTCNCLYHQIFFGRLKSTVTCLTCKNETVVEDPFAELCLDLHDLRQQAKRKKLDPKSAASKALLDDAKLELTQCLKSFTTPERLAPDAYTCRSKECGDTPQRSRKHLTIRKLPPALCIQLKVGIVGSDSNHFPPFPLKCLSPRDR